MEWVILFFDEFEPEFDALPVTVQNELLAHARLLAKIGPTLGRPYVDTLEGSKHPNMKELRFRVGPGVWRVAFAFDPNRSAVLLVAGDKRGANEKRFYRSLIKRADERFDCHLEAIRDEEN